MDASANNITFEYHDELNPTIWTDKNLKPEIREKLLEIAEAFIDYLEIDIDVEDITLTGSLANYNYTKYSDFDLHIVTDFKEYDTDKDLLKDYFNAKKTIWNTTRDITIKGYDVELYVQDKSEPHHSTGVYSLKNDEWITEPKIIKGKEEIDLALVAKKKQAMLDIINYAVSPECDVECAEKQKEKFMNLRKAALEKGGEFAPENLAFKELRRSGDVERLVQGILAKKNKALSLDSIQTEELSFKNFIGIDKKRGPRHQSLTAGMNKIGRAEPGKSLSMVAQMHKKKKNDTFNVHNLKKKNTGISNITNQEAQRIITTHNLDINKIKNGQPRKLSTSNIELGYNPLTNMFFLRKY
jgi:predicted nucleotidyltransferase